MTRFFRKAASIVTLSVFISIPNYASADLARVDLNGGAISLGQGYDSLIDEPRGFCVKAAPESSHWASILERLEASSAGNVTEETDVPIEGETTTIELPQQVFYRLRVMDSEDYRREYETLSISASGSYGGFSASASFESEREYERTEYNLFIVLTVDVSNRIVGGDFFSPKEKFANGGRFELNESECGTSFVMAIGLGGRLEIVARVNTVSESERSSMRATLGGGGSFAGGGAKASVSFSKMVETALERRDVNVSIRSAGPWLTDNTFGLGITGGNFDLTDVDNLKRLVNSAILFPAAVSRRPWPYVGYLADYETVGFERQNIVAEDERRRILSDLFFAARRYDLALTKVRSAEANPDVYEVLSSGVTSPATEKINEIMRDARSLDLVRKAIGEAAAKCYRDNLAGAGECISISEIEVEGNPVPASPSFTFGELRLISFVDESELCSEDASFAFPHLVPANGGCIDPGTSLVWSNPHFSVEADIAKYFCESKSRGSEREWRVPNERDVRFLVSGAFTERAKKATKSNPVARLFSDTDGVTFDGVLGDPKLDNWLWSSNDAGDINRVVNVIDRSSKDAGPTELYAIVCVSKVE